MQSETSGPRADVDLYALAVQDMLEIERTVAQNQNIAAVVQIRRRWPEGPQRYFISNGRGTGLRPLHGDDEAKSLGTGTPEVLGGFPDRVRREAGTILPDGWRGPGFSSPEPQICRPVDGVSGPIRRYAHA